MSKIRYIFVLIIAVSLSTAETAFSTNLNTHCSTNRVERLSVERWVSYFMSRSSKAKEEFKQKADFIHKGKYVYDDVEYKGAKTYVEVYCPTHQKHFKVTPNNHLSGRGCRECSIITRGKKRAKTHSQFLENLYEKSDCYRQEKLEILGDYVSRHKNILCKTKYGLVNVTPCNLLKNKTPTIESAVDKTAYFKNMVAEKNIDYVSGLFKIIGDYENQTVKILCEDKYGLTKVYSDGLLKGCKPTIETATDKNSYFINQAREIHGDKYDYSLVKYIDSDTNITIICPIHGKFEQTPANHIYRKQGCPKCDSSKGEDRISKCLTELNINFYQEHKFDGCKNINRLSFDFYLPDHKILIEYDGKQHFEPIKFFGGEKAFQYTKKLDKIKNIFAKENGYNLVRIPYTQFNEIESIIKNLFI